jgi:glycosyltransferase involved in cell wall biosynthesis
VAEPLVSVVVPVYNGERFLAEALGSIFAQDYRPLEVVVVDDGSTDGSARVARGFAEVVYAHQPNAGPAAARNLGARLARGDFLAFLDADDVWLPGKLTRQMAALATDPGLDMVFGHAEQFVEAGAAGVALTGPAVLPAHLPGALLIRRHRFDQVGGYQTDWIIGEVVDWYARAMEAGLKALTLDQVVYRRRLHGANLTLRQPEPRGAYLAVVRAALARRRGRPAGAAGDDPGATPFPQQQEPGTTS